MSFQLPPIVKLSEQLLLEIEEAVRRFPRYHKYAAGAELRAQAMKIATLVHRAWRDRPRQAEWVAALKWAIDELKIKLQLCMRLRAFTSFAQFEALARKAQSLGKQAGGWHRQKQQHPNGQNGGSSEGRQRAEKLSTRATSDWEVYK